MSEYRAGTVALVKVDGVDGVVLAFHRHHGHTTDWAYSPDASRGLPFSCSNENLVEVEKILWEPPVVYEVFGPGDVVRNRICGETYTLVKDGFVSHHSWRFYKLSPEEMVFTSRDWEKVQIEG